MGQKEVSGSHRWRGPFIGHTEKIYSIKFHPLASGLLVSSSYDSTVRLWNLESEEEVKVLTGHQDQVGDPAPHCSDAKLGNRWRRELSAAGVLHGLES